MVDQLGRKINLNNPPKRIVCLVPSLTELLVDLGLSDQLCGVTKFCVHPENLKDLKTIVGGTKSIHIDRITALKPDFILCNKEENTQEIVAACEQIAPVYVSDINDFNAFYTLVSDLGVLLNCQPKAEALNSAVKNRFAQFRKHVLTEPTRNVLYLIWRNPLMAAGRATFINILLEACKFNNVIIEQDSRYPEVDLELLKKADFVLLASEPFPFSEKHKAEFESEVEAQILCVDGEYFSWYGSRLLKAFDYFEHLLLEMH